MFENAMQIMPLLDLKGIFLFLLSLFYLSGRATDHPASEHLEAIVLSLHFSF